MIAALVLFSTGGALSLDEAAARFETTAPNYRNRSDLLQKSYIYAEDGSQLGGFYLWESREAAEAQYSEAWRARAQEIYGVAPVIRYFEVPVLIDNRAAALAGDD